MKDGVYIGNAGQLVYICEYGQLYWSRYNHLNPLVINNYDIISYLLNGFEYLGKL